MAQIARTSSVGTTIQSPAQIHGLIDGAKILPGAISEQTETSLVGTGDYALIYQASSNSLRKIRLDTLVFSPGDVLPTAATAVSGAWLLCDGAQYSQSAFPALFSAIGTTYGSADAGFFRVPDLRGRGVIGRDTAVEAAFANRVTAAGAGNSGVNSKNLGEAGGVDRWTLTLAEMPGHSHQTSSFGLATNTGTGDGATRLSGYTSTNTNIGGGQAHTVVQPCIVLHYKIKT